MKRPTRTPSPELEKTRSLKTWEAFFIVMEAYTNKELRRKYIEKTGAALVQQEDMFIANIKRYFSHCKEEKAIPKMSLATLQSVWFLISELRGSKPVNGYAYIAAIFGSPIFGSGDGVAMRFNAVKVDTEASLDYRIIKIAGHLAPQDFGTVRGFVTLEDVKDIIKNQTVKEEHRGIRG